MSTAELRAKAIKIINECQDDDFLKDFITQGNAQNEVDWMDELTPSQLERFEKSKASVKAGRVKSHKEVMQNAFKWVSE